MTTKVTTGHNPAHPIGTCGKCGNEMSYNVPRLGPNGGYVHKGTGRVECESMAGNGWRLLTDDEIVKKGDELRLHEDEPDSWVPCWATTGVPSSKWKSECIIRRRIDQPAPAASGIEAEVCADKLAICRSLAFKASNYYDALFLRTGNTAADNMQELAHIFVEEWMNKHPDKP